MDELSIEEKTVSVTFLVTPTMDKAIKKLLKNKKWRKSAFIRVALQKEIDRITYEK